MSKGDLWRRMSNYATAFVDFSVYYLVPVPYADVFAVERFMHRALPERKAFPSETKERGNLSEWFDCSQAARPAPRLPRPRQGPDAEPHRRLSRH